MEQYILEVLNKLILMMPAFIVGIFVGQWLERKNK